MPDDNAKHLLQAVVLVGVPLRDSEELIRALQGTLAEPARWGVFHHDARGLAQLLKMAERFTDVFGAIAATDGAVMREALPLILESEGIEPRCAICVQGNDSPSLISPASWGRHVFHTHGQSAGTTNALVIAAQAAFGGSASPGQDPIRNRQQ